MPGLDRQPLLLGTFEPPLFRLEEEEGQEEKGGRDKDRVGQKDLGPKLETGEL
ncbi:MAG: hypothetical protein ACM3ZC_11800 [Bacteroidota bacterium]